MGHDVPFDSISQEEPKNRRSEKGLQSKFKVGALYCVSSTNIVFQRSITARLRAESFFR